MNVVDDAPEPWIETPPDLLFGIERFVDGAWSRCKTRDLRAGDVVRFFSAEDDVPIHPLTHDVEPADHHTMALLEADPIKNFDQGYGYCFPVAVNEAEARQ